MAKTFSFEEASAPNAEADQIRAGVSGPMGATDEDIDREAQGTRESLAQVSDPQERQMLQEHLDATIANKRGSQPGPKTTFTFEEAVRPPTQQPLPAGVTASTAGAGRGVVNPPVAEAAPSTSGSTTTDMVRNFRGGLLGGVAGAGAALASAAGADNVAESLDNVRADLQQDQKDNGGDTIKGKAASLVGAVTPALLLPAARVAQLVGNAGLFAIPAFRDTLKAQLDDGRSFPLALAHAAEAFGINLFMPTVATKGSAAVTKALGAEGAQGVKAAAVQGAQAAGEGAAFSAGSSAIDKGTDVIAGQQNDHDWVDLKDVAASALGFSALRAAHTAPQAAQAVADRVGSPSRQFGRAMQQDVQGAQFGPAEDAAAQQAGVTLNPNLATAKAAVAPVNATTLPQATDDSPKAAVDDITAQLQAIRPLQDRAKKLRDAGEDVVADELDRRANTQAADIELQAHPDADQAFQGYYRTLRADGAKPAEASARAGMLGAFEQTASQAGISQKAVQAAIEKAGGLSLDKVPQFLDRYVGELTAAGIGTPVDIGHVASTVGGAGEAAMHRAIDTLYGREDATAPDGGKAPAEPVAPSIPGMERFAPETGTLGLSRADLPQIQAPHHGPLVNFLNARGIDHEVHQVDPATLKPSQAEFSPEKVKALAGKDAGDGSILVSQDGYVLDGHHRWLAAKEAGQPIKAIVLQAPIRELVDHAKEFPSAKSAEEAQGETQAAAAPDAGTKESGQANGPDAGGSAAGADTGGHAAAVGERYGLDHEPLSQGGKPYPTRKAAQKTRSLLRHTRLVKVEGGFALVDKSPAQLAAEVQASRRLSRSNTSEKDMPIPAHAFIAAEGGLRRAEMADSGFDRNVRVGNRTLFAAAGKGLTIAQATEKLQQAHYLPAGAGHNQAYDLIRRSVSDPQYNPEGWTRIAENESNTRFEDYLKAEQEHDDPLTPLPEEYLKNTGADELTPEERDQLHAAIAAAEAEGVDTESLLEDAARKTENGTAHDYYREATDSLQAAPRPEREGNAAGARAEQGRRAAEPEGGGSRSEVPGEQGARRGQAQGLSWQVRDSGTLAVKGDPAKIREVLKDIPSRSFMVMDGGYMVGRTQVDKAIRALEGKSEEPKAAKPLSMGTAPGDVEPVTVKDGVIHIGKHEAIDFDSGEPVKVKADASTEDIKKALRDAGVLGKRQKFFGGVDNPQPVKVVKTDALGASDGVAFSRSPVERFEVGKSLSKEQRRTVLKTLTDVYKVKGAPREQKGVGRDGNERYGYVHSPDLFEKSDITGAAIRYHVTLPDGRIAHPSELFPDYTQADVDRAMIEQDAAEKQEGASQREVEQRAEKFGAATPADADASFLKRNLGFELRDWRTGKDRAFVHFVKDGKFFTVTSDDTTHMGRLERAGWKRTDGKQDLLGEAPNDSQQAAAKLKGEKADEQRRREAAAPPASDFTLKGSDRKADADPDQTPMFSRTKTEPFYSALGREVDAIGARAMPAEGWSSRIKGLVSAGKVKADEVEWTGLNDWLKLQQGKVTREQIGEFLNNNGVQVKEVTKEERAQWRERLDLLDNRGRANLSESEKAEMDRLRERFDDERGMTEAELEEYQRLDRKDELGSLTPEERERFNELGYRESRAYSRSVQQERSETKFGQYTLPGGTNYREVLLTLPPKEIPGEPYNVVRDTVLKPAVERAGISGDFRRIEDDLRRGRLGQMDAQGKAIEYEQALIKAGEKEALDRYYTSFNHDDQLQRERGKVYRSSHWDEPNVLAHIRLNDRTDADGKKVLFVEELQSDWAQEGRKRGFLSNEEPTIEVTRVGQWNYGSSDNDTGKWRAMVDGRDIGFVPGKTEAEARQEAKDRRPPQGVPRAPFVDKTDAWLSLALKRVIKLAADEGYDRVAFVNGEQSADRYKLSKQVNEVSWRERKGNKQATVDLKGGDQLTFHLDENGVVKSVDGTGERTFIGKSIDEVVGKDLAAKITSEEEGRLAGNGLDIGGSGMKSFYDKIVPSVAKDVLKKLGGDGVKTIEFPRRQPVGPREDDGAGGLVQRTVPAGWDVAETGTQSGEIRSQPGFDITPAMREKVAGGVPLFKRADTAPSRISDTKRTAIDSAVQRLTRDWLRKPAVHVIDGMNEAPDRVFQEWQRQESQGASGEPEGFHYRGDVYLLSPHMKSMDDVRRVLFHESLGHFGLRGVFGDTLKPILAEVAAQRPQLIAEKAEQYGLDVNKASDRLIAAEEVLAEMAQSRPDIGFVRKAIAAIRTWLREHGIVKTMSDDEILRNYLLPARGFVERGRDAEKSDAVPAFSRSKAEEAAGEPAKERKPYTGPGAKLIEINRGKLAKMVDDAVLSAAPMSAGSDVARAVAKDYANAERLARWQWTKFDDILKKNFTEAERKQMWEAGDEQNVLLQKGEDTKGKGLDRLNPEQRKVMDTLHEYGESLLQRAKEVGMFKGEGLPYWTPRMAVMIGGDGEYLRPSEGQTSSPDGRGFNVTKTAGSLKQRKHLTAEDTEAAMKGALGEGAQLVRDIRTMPLAMARLERAIAGRELINQIKEIGDNTGTDTTSTTGGAKYFTLDHPGFKEYRYRPDVKMSEARDKHLWDGLMKFAADIGVRPERVDALRGKTWGYATRAGEVVTRFGGPESVLTHELGHQLDFKYGLADMLTRRGATAKELRALADLRFEGLETSDYFKKYVRKGTEKIANMVHAYVHMPERFKEVAPASYKAFTEFLDAHPELAGLKKIKPSLVLQRNDTSKRPPGEDFDVLPLYISRDFEGPLKAILTEPTGELYKQMMNLKSKSMGLIMYSPLIHNAVEWGRALPIMPGKVLTFRVYFEGNKIKNDPLQMAQAIKDGMVPIGHRGQMQDITGIMEDPSLAPGRSWTAKLLGGAVGAVNARAGTAVKKGIDAAGDVWHNTLLWDRVGDLQAGIYGNMKADLTRRGMDEETAGRLAAHFANRYAGALPNEAMSANARKIANFVLFSRSFTMGNLGVMKDMVTGFPPDIAAQINRDAGELALKAGKSVARRTAIGAFALDIALMYAGNSLMQSALDHMKRDKDWDQIEQEYLDRFHELMARVKENPLEMIASPFEAMSSLTSNSANEPGKEDRIHFGTDESGTNIYMRAPFGKVGEEFKNWVTSPFETLLRKQGTIMRPITQTIENDKGFGQRVYNPDDKSWAGIAKNVGKIVWNFMAQQFPADSVQGAVDWAQGHADDTDKLKAVGPLAGVTFSKGAPGGPEVGEMYHESKVQQGRVADAMPDVRRALKINDIDKAVEIMEAAGMSEGQIRSTLKKNLDPGSRLSAQALKKYYGTASEESKRRMDNYGR